MKCLIPVDGSQDALAAVEHLARLRRRGESIEAVVLNVQPRLPHHVARFSRKVDRDALRAERSRAAMARALETLSRAGVAFRALAEVGAIAERIAAVAHAERVDQIVMGVGRRPRWLGALVPSMADAVAARTDVPVAVVARGRPNALERYLVPAGVAGLAALLIAAE